MVAVVLDSGDQLREPISLLKQYGFTVESVQSAEKALNAAVTHSADLLISDAIGDESSLSELLRRIHENPESSGLELLVVSVPYDPLALLAKATKLATRRRAEVECRRRDQHSALLEETQRIAHIGSFEWHIESNRWICSDELYRIFGMEPRSVEITTSIFFRKLTAESLPAVGPFTREHVIQRKDGRRCLLQIRGEAIVDSSGETTRLVGAVQDITALVRPEENS
jgi:PAS domain-containing protein